jgi:hypothetical protein
LKFDLLDLRNFLNPQRRRQQTQDEQAHAESRGLLTRKQSESQLVKSHVHLLQAMQTSRVKGLSELLINNEVLLRQKVFRFLPHQTGRRHLFACLVDGHFVQNS